MGAKDAKVEGGKGGKGGGLRGKKEVCLEGFRVEKEKRFMRRKLWKGCLVVRRKGEKGGGWGGRCTGDSSVRG